MYIISNQHRREIIEMLTEFIETKATKVVEGEEPKVSTRIINLKRRAGLLIRRLNQSAEVDFKLLKELTKKS